jgi:hypothetical protein
MARCNVFMSLFRAELDDSIEGLEYLSKVLGERLDRGEITNYVYSENEAFLNRAVSAFRALTAYLDTLDTGSYTDVRLLAEDIEGKLKEKVEELDDPKAISEIIERKAKKVLKYIFERPE